MPVQVISHPTEAQDELVLALPNNLQSEFMESVHRGDFVNCSQLLSYAVEGSINILSSTGRGRILEDSDLIHCAFRLFLSLLPRIPSSAEVLALLRALKEARRTVAKRLDMAGNVILLYQLALAVLSAAIRFPGIFEIGFLRDVFLEALQAPDVVDQSRKLIPVYWICLLWGCLMQLQGRSDEAIASLTNLRGELVRYSQLYPGLTSAALLQQITVYNIETLNGY